MINNYVNLLGLFIIFITKSFYYMAMPIIVLEFPSIYFILISMTLHSLLNYAVCLSYMKNFSQTNNFEINNLRTNNLETNNNFVNNKILILISGTCHALSNIFYLYTVAVTRTPIILQSNALLLGMSLTMILRNFFTGKKIQNFIYFTFGIVLIIISCCFCIIPYTSNINKLYWAMSFMVYIILSSLSVITQELYLEKQSLYLLNNVRLQLYNHVIQIIIIVCFCWIDKFIGFSNDSFELSINNFLSSIKHVFEDPIIYIFVLVIVYIQLTWIFIESFINEFITNYVEYYLPIINGLIYQFPLIFYIWFDDMYFPNNFKIIIVIVVVMNVYASIFFRKSIVKKIEKYELV
ncbi:putative ORFan [Cotonvirus japonicus]|uniref:ORFan n=1 Tax=Cotonvirus japonicus TaxID=2811091 RepID=A0ABM7NRR9_9VIRU|nr:putative ORFan [Cotonvirus japonicus]BCS82851.1 putative ORFan [Cotonvirus japonicus]